MYSEMDLGHTACCGIREITNLSDFDNAREALQQFCLSTLDWKGKSKDKITKSSIGSGLVIFTGVVSQGERYVQNFKALLEREKLGPVTISTGGYNPNHPDHMIKMCVWVPDSRKLTAWWNKNQPAEYKEDKKETADYNFANVDYGYDNW